MTVKNVHYCLILDANAWVTERMLHSLAGSATLFAVAANGATIALPEIVESEVARVLQKQAKDASAQLRKNLNLLRDLSGHEHRLHPVPNEKAIQDGIAKRWDSLGGALVRAPFTFEHAKASLQRILDHTPPCGPNNEQFRDCCIWETALELAKSSVVHFVTDDSAFYEKGDRDKVAAVLQNELEDLGRDVRLHRSVQAFLAAVSQDEIKTLERNIILDALVRAATPKARDFISDRLSKNARGSRLASNYELGEARNIAIKGYATPKRSIVAITFSVIFDLLVFETERGEERQLDTTLLLEGSCAYNPAEKTTSELSISSWTHSINSGGGVNTSMYNQGHFERMPEDLSYI